MKSKNNGILRKVCVITGAVTLFVAVAALIFWQLCIHNFQQRNEYYVKTIQSLIPSPEGAFPEERRDNTMSALYIDGIGFVGILEFPRFDSVLPVCESWGNSFKYPSRFSGSVYDRSIIIGATSQKGQYDFYREISVGDRIYFTDMEGNRYSYSVTDIRYEKNADISALNKREASLTVFIKNVSAFEYIIVFCNVLD